MLSQDARDVASRRPAFLVLPNPACGQNLRRLAAEADENDRRAAAGEETGDCDDEGPPERKMATSLVRIAVHGEAAEGQRRIQKKHALADPSIGDRRSRLDREGARFDFVAKA